MPEICSVSSGFFAGSNLAALGSAARLLPCVCPSEPRGSRAGHRISFAACSTQALLLYIVRSFGDCGKSLTARSSLDSTALRAAWPQIWAQCTSYFGELSVFVTDSLETDRFARPRI